MEIIVKNRIGAYGVIIHDGQIALVKKANGGYKGKLDLPGGGMEHKELPEETLKREILEEAGIHVQSFELIDATATNVKWEMEPGVYEDLHHIGILYKVIPHEYELKEDADGLDSLGAKWYPIEELKRENLSPFTIYALEKLGYKI